MATSEESAPPPKTYSTDPALYIFTSLTAGSSHIVTATSRLETILRANKVPFKAVDIATDERARMIWGRRAGKDESGRVRKLPGLVQRAQVLGDLVEIEDWNEYGELKQHVQMYYDEFTQPPISQKPKTPPPRKAAVAKPPPPAADEKKQESTIASAAAAAAAAAATAASTATSAITDTAAKAAETATQATLPIRSIAAEAAAKAKQMAKGTDAKKENIKSGEKAAPKADGPAEAKGEKEKPSPIPVPITSSSPPPALADLQSPTTGAWKGDAPGVLVSRTVQSPTSSSWVPKDVEPPITNLHGGKVASASAEEIKAVEDAAVIKEEPEEEDDEESEEDEEDEEDESEEESDEEEEEGEKKAEPVKKDEKKA